jgi:uncharacterized protein
MRFEPEFERGFTRDQIPELTPEQRRKILRFGWAVFGLIALLVVIMGVITPYTNFMWYTHDARQPQVFFIGYLTRGQLFALSFIASVAVLYFSLSKAFGVSLVYLRRPESYGELLISRVLGTVQTAGPTVVKVASLFLGFIVAAGFSANWQSYLLARNAQSFGQTDPIFGLDLGFFVFILPWYLHAAGYVLFLLLLTTAATIGIYVGMQVMASLAKVELARPSVRMHICLLAGLSLIALAAYMFLKRYEFGLVQSAQFTGASFAGIRQMWAQTIMSALVALLGVVVIVNGRYWTPFKTLSYGGAAVAAAYVIGMLIYPAVIQRIVVEPDKVRVESPFARRAIAMTRYAYGLDQIEVRDFDVRAQPTPEEIQASRTTIDNMRLWDPEVLRRSLERLQLLRPYYGFHDVDIDRYQIEGRQSMVMLAPRDIRLEGLTADARAWVNMRLQYTHGYGVTMSPVNTATTIGQPTFLIKNIPPVSPEEIPLTQPRIYFSDTRDAMRRPTDEYAIVNTQIDEFDYMSEEEVPRSYRWTGQRGVPIGGFATRLAYTVSLGDINVLISGNITNESRLLYRRNVLERASLIYPFLRFDNDPYIVIYNGRLVWILDGYTTTSQIPYSAMTRGGSTRINYIRNPVKVVIDAYTGEANAYAIEPDEPILRAYRNIYAGLVHDMSELPIGLERHFRYPEDMFMLQCGALTQYHVTDPVTFINNADAWELPTERGRTGGTEAMKAYFVQIRLPGEDRDAFLLILPFTPRERPNMSGWLAADCDPENYGRLTLYKFPRGSNMPGPAQMENSFNTDREIADINRQLNNEQSMIVPGNLLIVPIGQSVMYVKPLFLQSRTPGLGQIPELKKVIMAFEQPVVADTYQMALQRLLGQAPPAPRPIGVVEQDDPPPLGEPEGVEATELRRVVDLLRQADDALRAGDFARFGDLQRQARQRLEELAGN